MEDTQFMRRLKSLVWRGGMMALAVFVSFMAENIASLELAPWLTVSLGLAFGEVSKYLNTAR